MWLRVDFGDHARSILVGMKKERPSPKADGPFATQTATRAILFSLAKGLNHAATDALSSCRPERHMRDAEGKVDTGLPLDCQRLQDNRPIRSAGNGPGQDERETRRA